MQKKIVLGGLVVLVALLAIWVMIRQEPKTEIKSAYTLDKVEGLHRIEITPSPDAKGAPALIALERREDGWWLVQPVEAPVSERLRRELEQTFTRTIKADDLTIGQDKAKDYLLDEGQQVRLKLFTRGAPAPYAELLVGKQIVIESTRALRTFIKPVGASSIYRLQAGLAFVREPNVSGWRSDEVLAIQSSTVTGLTIAHPGQPAAELKREGEVWSMAEPEAGMRLELPVVNDLVNALGNLRATGFIDDKRPEELGLTPDKAIRVAITHGQTTTLLLAPQPPAEAGREGTWAVQIEGKPAVYVLSKAVGDRLTPTVEGLRSLTLRPIPRETIKRVVYASGVTLEKIGESWQLVAPERRDKLDPAMVDSALAFLADVRAMRRAPEISLKDAGLHNTAKLDVTRLETTTGEVVEILLGGVLDPKESHRYARLRDSQEIFVIDKYTARRLAPNVSEWTTTAP
jgi:hypothetical protein